MPTLIALLAAYGLCFFLQQKATPLHGKNAFLDRLLHCTYCTGFHCGWMVWVVYWLASGSPTVDSGTLPTLLVWAFASSAFCYAIDAAVRWFEVRTPVE